MFYYSNIMECSKSAGFPTFIKNMAWEMGLNIQVDIDETGWLFKRQTIRFKVQDESKDKIKKFAEQLHASIDDYQRRLTGISGYRV